MQIQESMCYNWIESMHPELKSFNEAIYKKTWTNEIKLKKSMHMTQMWWEGIYLFSLMAVLTLTIFQSNPLKKKKKKRFPRKPRQWSHECHQSTSKYFLVFDNCFLYFISINRHVIHKKWHGYEKTFNAYGSYPVLWISFVCDHKPFTMQ